MKKFIKAFRFLLVLSMSFLATTGVNAKTNNVTVDCALGNTVSDALAALSGDTSPVVVTMKGLCDKGVTIQRDDVTLQGATAADGFKLTSFDTAILVTDGSHRILVQSMMITVNGWGIVCAAQSSVSIKSVSIAVTGAGSIGLTAVDSGHCSIANSTLTGPGTSGTGVYSGANSNVDLISSTVEGFGTGVAGITNGTLFIGPLFNEPTATIIRNNNYGLVLQAGASAQVTEVLIEKNTANGIGIFPGSSLSSLGRTLTVSNNGALGVFLYKNASVLMTGAAKLVIQGNKSGAATCQSSSAAVVVTGNATAQITGAVTGC